MYHKFIGDREVFSECKTLHTEEGWISNPTTEQIAADGWTEYIPPVTPPVPATEPGLNQVIEAVKRMLSTETSELSDEDALDVAALFPTWASKLDREVAVGDRLWYDGKLYKVLQAHTTQSDWTPDNTPALYAEVSIEEWPDWQQPLGSEDAYAKDDKVTHVGKHWVSLVDGNVWEPGAAGTEALWKEV